MGRAVINRQKQFFLLSVFIIFIVNFIVFFFAIIEGAVEEYGLPMTQWSASVLILQWVMVLLYTIIITALLSLPVAIFFFSKN